MPRSISAQPSDSLSTATPSAAPLAAEFARALVAGSIWAAICCGVTGLPALALLPLSVGASTTVLLCLWTWGAFDPAPELRGQVGGGAALLALGALFIGQVLQTQTHHRPLGAVVWVLLLVGLVVPTLAVVRRVKPNAVAGSALAATACLLLAWIGRNAIEPSTWIQWGAGVACVAGALLHRARLPRAGAALSWPVALSWLAAATWVLWSRSWNSAQLPIAEHAALALGWVGLL